MKMRTAGPDEIVDCASCGMSQVRFELCAGMCLRCGGDPADASLQPRVREEIGYRRGFDQGYAAALREHGISGKNDPFAGRICVWRHDWPSIIRRARGRSYTECPPC